MGNKPLSQRVKKHKSNQAKERKLRQAAATYNDALKSGNKLSFRQITKMFPTVSKSTLERYVTRKSRTMTEYNTTKQMLSVLEEDVLVDFILESADRGFPLKHSEILQYANTTLQGRLGPNSKLSYFWVFRFLDRHHEKLAAHWSKSLDMQRAKYLNPDAVKSWFDIVEKFIVRQGIEPGNIYGMDESGFPTAYNGKEKVVGARGTKTQHKQGGADRENVTGVVTICADGSSVRPLLIFKGKYIKESWIEGNEVNAFIATSENGWTDGNLGRQWLEHVFDVETKVKAAGKTRALLLDGHSSHYTLDFIDYARENTIMLLGYPAHCTHALQGLDVVCFAKMKDAWKKEIGNFEDENLRVVVKKEFTYLWSRAYISAFVPETISAAFRVTGVHPFSREVITEAQMKPSLTSSVKGSFPLPQPSPVRAVMSAFNANPPTTFMISPSTHTPYHRADGRLNTHDENEDPSNTPCPSRRHHLDVDPDLFTPSKRMRPLYAGLSQTSSGSFLVSKTKLTSSTPILAPVLEDLPSLPHPDWSLVSETSYHGQTRNLEEENQILRNNLRQAHALFRAQSGIIEGANATMVIQNLHLRKLNGALYGKEIDKQSNRTLVIDASKGQVYSGDEIRNGLQLQEERKRAIAAAKRSKVETRAAKKEAQAKLDNEWKKIKADHKERVKKWKLTCETLAAEGESKKNWPKRPVCSRKPKLPATLQALGDEEDGGDEEDDENVADDRI